MYFVVVYYTPDLAQMKLHWKMPLKIHWTIPVKLHWGGDNPLDDAAEQYNCVGMPPKSIGETTMNTHNDV